MIMKNKISQSKMVNILGVFCSALAVLFIVCVVLITLANGHLNDAYENLHNLTILHTGNDSLHAFNRRALGCVVDL